MDEKDLMGIKKFYQTLEEGIKSLPAEEQEKLYKSCGMNCAKDFVLKEQKRQFEECHGDLDLQYTKYGHSEYFFAEIIEKGHIYEIGYPRCLCYMFTSGFASSPVHCECSRQSILYVLHELMPDKKIEVETIETVLSGAEKCRFRVVVE